MDELIELLKTRWVNCSEMCKILNIKCSRLPIVLLNLGEKYPLAQDTINKKTFYKIINDDDFIRNK